MPSFHEGLDAAVREGSAFKPVPHLTGPCSPRRSSLSQPISLAVPMIRGGIETQVVALPQR